MPLLRAFLPYLLAVIAAVAVGEALVRVSTFEPAQWYPQVIERAGGPVRFIFVGSSRVGSGVNVEQFAEAVPGDATMRARRTFNMGHGFSTIAAHAIGLREMAEQGLLRDAVVFVEAAGAVPDMSTWQDRWFFTESPGLLISVMGARDLPGLWRSDMAFEQKLSATARRGLGFTRLATYRENIRVQGLSAAYQTAGRAAANVRGAPPAAPAPHADADLRAEGGVRGDIDDRSRIRAAATTEGRRMLDEQRLVADWDALVAADILRIVRGAGGRVVFFEMPLSTPMRVAAESEMGRANAESFRRQMEQWGTWMIPAQRTLPDDDFPDLWHMSATAADMFTRDLIAAWLARASQTR